MKNPQIRLADANAMEEQRMAACPPHLRWKLFEFFRKQQGREHPVLAEAQRAIDAVLQELQQRLGVPTASSRPKLPIDLHTHRRRWLP